MPVTLLDTETPVD